MNDPALRNEINKRLTLNWLIQGAAQHAGITFHYLVKSELDAIHPNLLRLYDQYALINLLQYWRLEAVLLLGWPPRFWKRAARQPSHPFFGHALLSRHGGSLAVAAKQRAVARAKEKGLSCIPGVFGFQAARVIAQLQIIEASHARELITLAKIATERVWGIPIERLNAELTTNVAFGNLSRPSTIGGRILRGLAVGYGGVLRRDESIEVVARATNLFLLAKELVKGTAELICLHGINHLRDDTYRIVMQHADRIEFEPWMLQSGGELWRQLLAVLPAGRRLADMLMHLARLPANSLERLMLAVLEQPDLARDFLAGLGVTGTDEDAAID